MISAHLYLQDQDITLSLTFFLVSILVHQDKFWHGDLLSLFQVLELDTPTNLLSNSSSEFSKMLSVANDAVATRGGLRRRT
jgi:hypothetical protein